MNQVCELLLEDHHPLVQERETRLRSHTKGEFVAVEATKTLCFVLSLSISSFEKRDAYFHCCHYVGWVKNHSTQYQCSSSEVKTHRL